MGKHTPGPWTYNEWGEIYAGNPSHGTRVDVAYAVTHLADARLLAAAPELLGACEALRGELIAYAEEDELANLQEYGTRTRPRASIAPVLRQARGAIAKAKGENDAD